MVFIKFDVFVKIMYSKKCKKMNMWHRVSKFTHLIHNFICCDFMEMCSSLWGVLGYNSRLWRVFSSGIAIVLWRMFRTVGDVISIVGDTISIVEGYHQYCGGVPQAFIITSTVPMISLTVHVTDGIPPILTYSYPPYYTLFLK